MGKRIKNKDISRRLFWLAVAAVFAAKAVLGRFQLTYVWVGGAPLDDELMFHAAQSITAGQWLGPYGWLTLSKQMFFAVWLAFCHALRLPYLVAGQLLMCTAALAMARAFAPMLQKRWQQLLVFAAVAFSPAAAATFTLRVYRDNIFPAECVLFFAGIIGAALRYRQGVGRYALWLVLAGVGLGTARITREDGIWLLPFGLVAAVIVGIYIAQEKGLPRKALRLALQVVPYLAMAVCVLAMSFMNYRYYGVFTTSDFSEGSFAAAYGAMTRVAHAEGDSPMAPVPYSVRAQLYRAVPQLAPLEYWLEEDAGIRNGYIGEGEGLDYAAGGFYWVLRRAAAACGVYETAQTADAYWAEVAQAINARIADGTLTADAAPRKSTAPIIRAAHVLPTLQEMGRSLVFCATFQDCDVYFAEIRSEAEREDFAIYCAYLGNDSNEAAMDGSPLPAYTTLQRLVYLPFGLLRPVYAVLLPLLLGAALVLQVRAAAGMLRAKSTEGLLPWLVLLGLLGMALLRCAMIAFMEVAAFRIGTSTMYLASVHPLLLVYAVVGVLAAGGIAPKQKENQ